MGGVDIISVFLATLQEWESSFPVFSAFSFRGDVSSCAIPTPLIFLVLMQFDSSHLDRPKIDVGRTIIIISRVGGSIIQGGCVHGSSEPFSIVIAVRRNFRVIFANFRLISRINRRMHGISRLLIIDLQINSIIDYVHICIIG